MGTLTLTCLHLRVHYSSASPDQSTPETNKVDNCYEHAVKTAHTHKSIHPGNIFWQKSVPTTHYDLGSESNPVWPGQVSVSQWPWCALVAFLLLSRCLCVTVSPPRDREKRGNRKEWDTSANSLRIKRSVWLSVRDLHRTGSASVPSDLVWPH